MSKVRVGLLGVGNCASSLVQGIHYYKHGQGAGRSGLMHENIGGYGAGDVEVVAAFDIDARKVGTDLSEAIFAPPNCTTVSPSSVTPPTSTTSLELARAVPVAKVSPPTVAEIARPRRDADSDFMDCLLFFAGANATRLYSSMVEPKRTVDYV